MERYRRPLPCISHYGYIFALSTFAFNLSKLDKQNKKCPLHFGRLRPYRALTLAFAFSFNTLLSSGVPLLFTYVLEYIKTYYNSVPTFHYLPFSPNNSAPLLVLSSLFDGAILRRIFGLEKTFCIKIIYDQHKFSLYLSVYKGCRAKKNFCSGVHFF